MDLGEVQRELEVEVEVEVRCGGCGCGGGMVEVDGGGQTTSRLDRYISSILRRTTRENLNWSVSFLLISLSLDWDYSTRRDVREHDFSWRRLLCLCLFCLFIAIINLVVLYHLLSFRRDAVFSLPLSLLLLD